MSSQREGLSRPASRRRLARLAPWLVCLLLLCAPVALGSTVSGAAQNGRDPSAAPPSRGDSVGSADNDSAASSGRDAPMPRGAGPLPGTDPDPESSRNGAPKDTSGDPFPGLGGESPSCRTATGDAALNCRASGSIAHRYPIGNYGFDIHVDTGFDAPSGSFFSAIQNVLEFVWLALLYFIKGVLLLLDWAFSLNLVNDNMADLRRGLAQLDGIFGDNSAFFLAAIAGLGLWGVWRGFVQRQTIQTIGGLAASVGLMVAALVIINNPVGTVGQVSAIANGGARSVTATMADAGSNGAEGSDGLSAGMQSVFDAIALRPWCALQFGDVDFCMSKPPMEANLYDSDAAEFKDDASQAPTVADLFLKFPANGQERNDLYENWKGDGKVTQPKVRMMKRGSTGARVALLAVIAVGILGAVALLAWLGFKLVGYSILALFLILLAPVMLLLAALGESGRRTFIGWGKYLFVALIAEFLFSVLLGLVLFTAALLGGLHGVGWFGVWLIQTIFWWTAFLKRHEIMGWLTLGGTQLAARRGGVSPLYLGRQLAAPARRAAEVAGVGARRAARESAVAVRHSRREGNQAAARTVLGRHADRALDREYAHARSQMGERRRMQAELRAIEDELRAPGLDPGGEERLQTRREALLGQLASPEWRHAERLVQRADDHERELGQRWTAEDREKWAIRRRNELARSFPIDDPRNLLAAGVDPDEYARAGPARRAELRAQAEETVGSQERLLRGIAPDRAVGPSWQDARAARAEIQVSERLRHQAREHRALRRDAARRRAREHMYRPWR